MYVLSSSAFCYILYFIFTVSNLDVFNQKFTILSFFCFDIYQNNIAYILPSKNMAALTQSVKDERLILSYTKWHQLSP